MRATLIIILLLLPHLVAAHTLESAAPPVTRRMWQPQAIAQMGTTQRIAAVELATLETRITLISPQGHDILPTEAAYASDEADCHYPLLRVEHHDSTLVLVFRALPQDTRLLDIVADQNHRWMGVHSAVHGLRLPRIRPLFNPDAVLSDSVEAVLHANALASELASDSAYAVLAPRLQMFRDYVAWKWHLTPHAVYLLQRLHEHPADHRSAACTSTDTTVVGTPSRPLPSLPHGPRARKPNFFQRLFGTKKENTRKKEATGKSRPRPLSRFEQKMLQEIH